MKISKISPLNVKRTRTNTQQKEQDLTSFGANDNKTFVETAKASDAIKSNFLSGISFKGQTQNIIRRQIGTAGVVAVGREPTSSYSDSNYMPIEQKIGENPLSHANSSIEKTHNDYTTDRVYYADPEEYVSEQTKRDHDYIVYDNRPKYPTPDEIRENYFNVNRNANNYGQNFKTLAEYYYRLEQADKKELQKLLEERNNFQHEYDVSAGYKQDYDEKTQEYPWEVEDIKNGKEKADYFFSINAQKYDKLNEKIGYYQDRINHSKMQQKKAIQAFKIFDEVGLMFMDRDNARNKIEYQKRGIQNSSDSIARNNRLLNDFKKQKADIEKQIQRAREWKEVNDEKVNAPYSDYSQYDRMTAEYKKSEEIKEKDEAKAESIRLSQKLSVLQDRLNKINLNIMQGEKANHEHQLLIDRYRKSMPELEAHFKCKAEEIKTFYPKMEEFYRNNIEEWQY